MIFEFMALFRKETCKLQVSFRKRAMNSRALLREMDNEMVVLWLASCIYMLPDSAGGDKHLPDLPSQATKMRHATK